MRIPFLWADHRPRIEFYVREGLLERAPSDGQIAQVVGAMKYKVGPIGQMRFYWNHPGLIFPSAAKQKHYANPRAAGDHTPVVELTAEHVAQRARAPLGDRFFHQLLLFSPARFIAKTLCNPWEALPSSGMNTPAWGLIAHILQTNHPPPGIWDIQVIHPDPGALDALERQVDAALSGRGLRARVDRALGCQPNHFEDLKDLIPRIRRFEYPRMPEGVDDRTENFVSMLRHAAEL